MAASNESTLQRTFSVVEYLSREKRKVPLQELAGALCLTSAAAHRLLNGLMELGYVDQDENKRYYLTYKVYKVAGKSLNRDNFLQDMIPYMNYFAMRYGCEVGLTVFADRCFRSTAPRRARLFWRRWRRTRSAAGSKRARCCRIPYGPSLTSSSSIRKSGGPGIRATASAKASCMISYTQWRSPFTIRAGLRSGPSISVCCRRPIRKTCAAPSRKMSRGRWRILGCRDGGEI